MRFKKLRKVYRVYFPIKFTAKEIFENCLKNNKEIDFFEKEKESYKVFLKNGISLYLRNEYFSDYLVFEQIFNFKEYEIVVGMIGLNNILAQKNIIIDAGANVGYTSVFFNHYLSNAFIFAIEPSFNNAQLCLKNFTLNNLNKNVHFYQRALSHESGMTFNLERDFRDGKDWAITTTKVEEGEIKGITLIEIIEEHKLEFITLLKIDIEGAERFIFNHNVDLSFLKITKIIAIEIHDEFNVRELVYSILKDYNFYLFECGELTIGFNGNYIKSGY
jgi:FkbM family methyltransferase